MFEILRFHFCTMEIFFEKGQFPHVRVFSLMCRFVALANSQRILLILFYGPLNRQQGRKKDFNVIHLLSSKYPRILIYFQVRSLYLGIFVNFQVTLLYFFRSTEKNIEREKSSSKEWRQNLQPSKGITPPPKKTF